MNSFQVAVIFVFLAFTLNVAAEMTVDLTAGENKWGYAGGHAAATQPWNGTPFTIEAEIERPVSGTPGFLPRESWFGLFIEDGKNRSRFSFGPFNPKPDADPKQLPFSVIRYEKGGNFNVAASEISWGTDAKTVYLKADFNGETLAFFCSPDGENYRETARISPVKPFAPNRIGVTLDSYHDRTALTGLRVHKFRVTGNGPAKSDSFTGTTPVAWNFSEPKRAEFLYPVALELQWRDRAGGNNVFDRGQAAVCVLRARTTLLAGKAIEFYYRCFDREGNELWSRITRAELAVEPLTVTETVPAEVISANGVYRFVVEAAVGDNVIRRLEQQFAVITPTPVTAGKFDRRSPYSGNYFADWNLAARIGIRQIRQTYWNIDEFEKKGYAELARCNGLVINGPLLDAGFRPQTPEVLEAKAARIAGLFLELEKRYPDFIYCQELYNEPENWPPTAVETDLLPFAALFARVREELRRSGSRLQLMTPGTTHVNLSFLKQLAVIGGSDVADIVAVHGYRSPNRPEFGHEEDVAAIRDLFGDKPIYVNEDAYFVLSEEKPEGPTTITQPFHTMIELDELTHGIYLQRKYLCQFMAGYSLVNQFDSIRNHSLSEHGFHRRPGIVTLAALTSALPHPELVRRRTGTTDHLWVTDWKSDGKLVTTLWSLNDFHEVTLRASEPLRVLDAFGNEIVSGNEVTLTVGAAPLFVLGGPVTVVKRAETAKRPAIVLPEEEWLGERPFALEVFGYARSLTQSVVSVTVRNNSGVGFAGSVTPHFMNDAPEEWNFTPHSQSVQLAPGESATLEFVPGSSDRGEPFDPAHPIAGKGYNALWWTEGYRVAVELKGRDGRTTLLHSRRPLCLRGIPFSAHIAVDGKLDDWAEIPDFPQIGQERKRNTALAKFWTGKADYTPSFKFAWNRSGLLFMAEVIDDKHDAEGRGLAAWRTDSVQLGLNARHRNPDFTDYMVLTLADGNPAILQRAMKGRAAGELPEVPLKIMRQNGDYQKLGRTLYECLIPWSLLRIDPERGEPFGFCVQFNESDGWWRKGWEGYFLQMGGHIVDPRRFGDLTPVR